MHLNKSRLYKISILVVFGALYIAASKYFLPIKNEAEHSTFDRGDEADLTAQCEQIKKGQSVESLGNVLSAHNRRNVASDEARKKITYWVSDGKSGVYYPNGFACVVELDLNGRVSSRRVESYKQTD